MHVRAGMQGRNELSVVLVTVGQCSVGAPPCLPQAVGCHSPVERECALLHRKEHIRKDS